EVGGMLAYRHPDHLQRRLWGVAANLAVLAGWPRRPPLRARVTARHPPVHGRARPELVRAARAVRRRTRADGPRPRRGHPRHPHTLDVPRPRVRSRPRDGAARR
ncbi:hypothetical protein ACWD6S_21905, partial [Streptomyces zhihengii]